MLKRKFQKWSGWLLILVSGFYWLLDFVSNLDFVVERFQNPSWIGRIPSFLRDPPRGLQTGIFIVGLAWLSYVYRRRSEDESKLLFVEPNVSDLNDEPRSDHKLDILFNNWVPPFEQSDRNLKLFSIGVMNVDSKITVEDVSVRLEKVVPNPGYVPSLEFREMVFPFADRYAKGMVPVNRSVNLNPHQVRYFEIVSMYEGTQPNSIELCFFPSQVLMPSGRYTLGLRATGKDVLAEYAEFEASVTDKGGLRFCRALGALLPAPTDSGERSIEIHFDDKPPYRDGWKDRSSETGMEVRYSVGVKNLTDRRLEHCRLIISEITPKVKNVEIYGPFNQIRIPPPKDETFSVNAGDGEFRKIVQFDEFEGRKLGPLGIELHAFSTEGYNNLPIDNMYVFTLQVSCDTGAPVSKKFEVGVKDGRFIFTSLSTRDTA